jgi:hypothetical protein
MFVSLRNVISKSNGLSTRASLLLNSRACFWSLTEQGQVFERKECMYIHILHHRLRLLLLACWTVMSTKSPDALHESWHGGTQ